MTDDDKQVSVEFEEKPEHPRSNLASMGIYIFSWTVLKEALLRDERPAATAISVSISFHTAMSNRQTGCLPMSTMAIGKMWELSGSYWEANMELVDMIPEFQSL